MFRIQESVARMDKEETRRRPRLSRRIGERGGVYSHLNLGLGLLGSLLLDLYLGDVLSEGAHGDAVGILHGGGPPRGLSAGAEGEGGVVAAEEVGSEEEGGHERGAEEDKALDEVEGGSIGVGDLLKAHAHARLGLKEGQGGGGGSP